MSSTTPVRDTSVAGPFPVSPKSTKVKEAEYKSVPIAVVTPDLQVKPYAEPAPPVVVAEARPLKQLPATASHVPLFAALGLLSLGGAFGLRILTNRAA